MKNMNRNIMAVFTAVALAVALVFALAGCGGVDGEEPVPEEIQEPAPEPEPVAEPAPEYAVNAEPLSYIGKTPEEIGLLLGDYEEATWFTGMVFRYGDFWFAYDGDSEYPEGAAILVSCPAPVLIEGLEDEIDAAGLDGVFGGQGVYEANENEGNEWYSGGYITYEYDGFVIDLGCGPDMAVDGGATALISAAPPEGDGAAALAEIIPFPFGCVWESLEEDQWYGIQHYRSLRFQENGEVEYNTGNKHIDPDIYETYETYMGTFQVFLGKEGSVGYDRITFDLSLDWWIWEFVEGAEDEATLVMKERDELKGGFRIWDGGGSMNLEWVDGQPLDLVSMGGDPVEDYAFWPVP